MTRKKKSAPPRQSPTADNAPVESLPLDSVPTEVSPVNAEPVHPAHEAPVGASSDTVGPPAHLADEPEPLDENPTETVAWDEQPTVNLVGEDLGLHVPLREDADTVDEAPAEAAPPPHLPLEDAPTPSADSTARLAAVEATVDLEELGLEEETIDESAHRDAKAGAEAKEPGEGDIEQARALTRSHLRGLLEALVFASDKPMKSIELARLASAPVKQVRELLAELRTEYSSRGVVLDEVAGGWLFRTSVQYAPFVRELSAEKPVRLTRAQVETLAIAAYRQPVTRPEIDDIRGVDSGATLKLLLERDLVRILGKKDEPGRPLLYGTTTVFLEFFGLKSLKDLPTLKEFTELSDESRRVAEAELGDVLPAASPVSMTVPSDTLAPPNDEHDTISPPPPTQVSPPPPAPDPEAPTEEMDAPEDEEDLAQAEAAFQDEADADGEAGAEGVEAVPEEDAGAHPHARGGAEDDPTPSEA